jgi:protein-tyrosine kinase
MSEATMNKTPRTGDSLIERAAEIYDFSAALRGGPRAVAVATEAVEPMVAPMPKPAPYVSRGIDGTVDKARLREEGFVLPDSPIGTLTEEFRLVKRQLLLRSGADPRPATAKDRMILVCSAQPNEGKTFCSVNLALSLASERDNEVLLVDADVAKPEVLSTLGLGGSAGLIDAIADPTLDVERLIIRTDIPKLSVLPAGKATNDDTELLSSARAAQIIEALATANERRIVILDSAPALAASPAGVLAHRVGRVLVVVRADRTTETELREAIALLDGCPDISLLLNAASFFGTNRTYGSYYGSDS